MKLKIEITMDNDAFQPDPREEVCRLLKGLADAVDDHGVHAGVAITPSRSKIRDINGNVVGTFTVVERNIRRSS